MEKLEFHILRWEELPSISYYADQVVKLINLHLQPHFSNEEVLTNAMVNNYVKNNLIDPPIKKQYNKEQIAKLFVICVLKQAYSMQEIKALINIALNASSIDIAYNKFCNLFEEALLCTYEKKDFIDTVSKNDNQYLLKSVLLSCSYKIYVKNIVKE